MIFRNKQDRTRNAVRKKARSVAIGYSQEEGIDCDFEPVRHSNADYAGYKVGLRHTSGFCQFIEWSLISWAFQESKLGGLVHC